MTTWGKHGLHPVAKRPKTATEKLKDHLADGGEEYASGARGKTPAILGMQKANVGESDEDYLNGWASSSDIDAILSSEKERIDRNIDERLQYNKETGRSLDATHPDNADLFPLNMEPSSKDFKKLTRGEIFMSGLGDRYTGDFRLLPEKDQYAILDWYKTNLEDWKDHVESKQREEGGSPAEWGGSYTPVEHAEDSVQNLADDIRDINKLKDAVARKDVEAIKKIPTHIRASSRFDNSKTLLGQESFKRGWHHGAKYITDWREAKKLNPQFSTGEAKEFALTNIAQELSHPTWYDRDSEFFPRGGRWPQPDRHRDYGDTGKSQLGPSTAQGTYFQDMMTMHSAAMYGDQEAKYKLRELSTDPEGDEIRYPHVNPKPGAQIPGIDESAREALPRDDVRDIDDPDVKFDHDLNPLGDAGASGQVGTIEEGRRGKQPPAFPSTREWVKSRHEGEYNPQNRFRAHEQRSGTDLEGARFTERPRQPRSGRFFREIPRTDPAYIRREQSTPGGLTEVRSKHLLENLQSYPIDAPRQKVPKLMEEFNESHPNRWVTDMDKLWDTDPPPEDPDIQNMQKANIQKAEENRKRLEGMTAAERIKELIGRGAGLDRSYRPGQPQHPEFAEGQKKLETEEKLDKALLWSSQPKENGKGRKVKTRTNDSPGGYPT